jgi:S1-C subfamily serine protease
MQGIAPKFTDGRISSMSGYRDDPNQFQISVPVQPGNSGGPLIHFASGRVAGVINARLNGQDAENVAYAIKTDVALKFLSSVSGLKLPASTSTPANAEEQIQKTRDSVVLVLVK